MHRRGGSFPAVPGEVQCAAIKRLKEPPGGKDIQPQREGGYEEPKGCADKARARAALGLDRGRTLRALEHESVLLSLRNLMTFPFVREAVEAGALHLHGIWQDLGDADLEVYDAATGAFRPI